MSRQVYLDNSATTPTLNCAIRAMAEAMGNNFGNPSSLHRLGVEAEEILLTSRREISRLLDCNARDIYFTSGATEANNTAIGGIFRTFRNRGNHIITTSIEHPSVKNMCAMLETEGANITLLPVDETGRIDPDDIRASVSPDTILVSVMAVNNEVGSIQPLEAVSEIIASQPLPRPFLHTDAVQAAATMNIAPRALKIDLLSVSAHKFHGPKGAGALYVREGLDLPPLLVGGGQESGLRSGTENTPAILGMGLAARWLTEGGRDDFRSLRTLRDEVAAHLQEAIPESYINGPPPGGPEHLAAPHILNVSFAGVRGEVLVHAMADRGVFISTGSACSSKETGGTGTLDFMPISKERVEGAVRLSMSPLNSREDIQYAVSVLTEVVPQLRRMTNRRK